MPVQDLYYKKYLKYKNKYLELKQYGGSPLEEATARIKDRVREDEENNKLIKTCKEFFVWPTSKVASQRKEDDEYVAKNDKSVTVDEAEAKHQKNIERRLEMDTLDNDKNKYIPLKLSWFADDSIIEFINFDNKHAVAWEAIEGGSEGGSKGYEEFDNYMQACEFVRDSFFRSSNDSYDWDSKYTKWKIVDVETGAIRKMDEW